MPGIPSYLLSPPEDLAAYDLLVYLIHEMWYIAVPNVFSQLRYSTWSTVNAFMPNLPSPSWRIIPVTKWVVAPYLEDLWTIRLLTTYHVGWSFKFPNWQVSFWDEMLVKGSAFGGCGADLPSSCFWPIPGIWTAPSLGPRSCKTEKANKKWENTNFEKLDQIRETWSFSVILLWLGQSMIFANKTYRISRFCGGYSMAVPILNLRGQHFRKDTGKIATRLDFLGLFMTTYEFYDLNPFPDVSCCPFRALLSPSSAEWSEASTSPSSWGLLPARKPVRQLSPWDKRYRSFFLEAMWIILTLRKCLAFGRGNILRPYNCQSDNCTEQTGICVKYVSRNSLHMSPLRLAD